ncbi:MAG: tripartite tricarboxylate transporter TctB family protein [Acidiferrobacterales bacterium]
MPGKLADMILAIVFIAIGLLVLNDIRSTEHTGYNVIESITFATMPSIYAGLLIGLSLLFGATATFEILRERRSKKGTIDAAAVRSEETSGASRKITAVRTVSTVVAVVVYVLLLEYIHFLALTAIFLFVMFQLYGQRSVVGTGAVAIVGAAALHGLFITILKLPI